MKTSKKTRVGRLCLFLLISSNVAWAQGFPGHWVARWIWADREPHPFHFFLMARRNFDLKRTPRAAALKITAADRYRLYLNGKYLGRGPARSDPRWTSFDTYDVGPRLRPGKNTVAVLAYHYGASNSYTRDARAGLFVQLEMNKADGTRQVIGTDKQWLVRSARGWRRDVDPINSAVGVTEVYDANLDPVDWVASMFDDSSWTPAYVIPERVSPWNYLETRRTPMMRENELFPVKVVSTGEVIETLRVINGYPGTMPSVTQVPERLASDLYVPLQHSRIERVDAILRADGNAALFQSFPFGTGKSSEAGARSPYLIVDFGRQFLGSRASNSTVRLAAWSR